MAHTELPKLHIASAAALARAEAAMGSTVVFTLCGNLVSLDQATSSTKAATCAACVADFARPWGGA